MSKNLVSIIIPTLNSESALKQCLESVKKQTYPCIETIIVDSFSKDNTLKIAKEYDCKIVKTKWKLLGARYLGFEKSKGEIILYLDSDQILKTSNAILRAVKMADNYDMIVMEEFGYKPTTLMQKLADQDRRLIQSLRKEQLNPVRGVMIPRIFWKNILKETFKRIDIKKLHDVVIFDDAIIYYEACKISKKVGFLDNAVYHNDPKGISDVFKHNYKYGATAKQFYKKNLYTGLVTQKVKLRSGSLHSKSFKMVLSSHILLSLKGISYITGYIMGR